MPGGTLGVSLRQEALVLRIRSLCLDSMRRPAFPMAADDAPVRVRARARVPRTRAEREGLRRLAEDFAAAHAADLVPPLVLDQLRGAAERTDPVGRTRSPVHRLRGGAPEQRGVEGTRRRRALRQAAAAAAQVPPAPRTSARRRIDEFGLVCARCGLCSIRDLQEEAERLGYAVLVAEGSDLVTSIIQTGKIGAIVGVSCLSVLERAFPYMEAAVDPGPRDSAAARRLQEHRRRSRLGARRDPPDRRRPHGPPGSRRTAQRGPVLVPRGRPRPRCAGRPRARPSGSRGPGWRGAASAGARS